MRCARRQGNVKQDLSDRKGTDGYKKENVSSKKSVVPSFSSIFIQVENIYIYQGGTLI